MKHLQLFENFSLNEQQYWGSIGAGILPVCPSQGTVLVGLRSDYVMEPNTWGTFGGKLDIDEGIDETIKEAALRELQEETRYMGHMKLVDAFIYRDGDRFSYHNFFGVVREEFTPKLNWENDRAVWMTLSELRRLSPKHFGLTALLKNSMDLLTSLLGESAMDEEDEEEDYDNRYDEEEDEDFEEEDEY